MRIVVLGAYGLAGSSIVRVLLAHTDMGVIAAGRDRKKLETLRLDREDAKLTTQVLDATDTVALQALCQDADVVINSVGPYAQGGVDIARSVIETGTHYMDHANEQIHYEGLKTLDALARDKGVTMMTAAGAIPGWSTLLSLHVGRDMVGPMTVEQYWAQGRMASPDSGQASLMGGVLDLLHPPRTLVNGVEVPVRLGTVRKTHALPPPFGVTSLLGLPTIDSLILPGMLPIRSMQTYWAIGDVPPGFPTLVRILRPHRCRHSYRFLKWMVGLVAKAEYRHAVRKGHGPECVLKVVCRNEKEQREGILRFSDGGLATAYLPVLLARAMSAGQSWGPGLVTPAALPDPDALLDALDAEFGIGMP